MGLFHNILAAIDNPEQEASPEGLGSVFDTVQDLASTNQINPVALQSAMSIVGNYTRSALQEKCNTEGQDSVQNLISQFSGTQANDSIVNVLFEMPQVNKMVAEIGEKVGIPETAIRTMLPVLVPLVLKLLKTGNNSANSLNSNSVLNSFLDADGDGDVDLADAMKMTAKYLNK